MCHYSTTLDMCSGATRVSSEGGGGEGEGAGEASPPPHPKHFDKEN